MPMIIPALAVIGTEIGAATAATLAGAGLSVGLSAGIGLAVSSAVDLSITLGATLAIGAITSAFGPKAPDPQAFQFTRKDAVPPRVSGFGRARLSGAYMNYATASDGTSVDLLALHDGPIDGFERFYLNDDQVTVRDDGWVTADTRADGRYSKYDKVQILTRLGATPETAITTVGGGVLPNWGASARGDGVAQLALGCRTPLAKYYETIYPNGLPQPSAVARLARVLDPRTGSVAWSDNPALALLAYLTTAAGGMGLDYATTIAPTVDTWTAAADDCDIPTPTTSASGDLAADAKKGATSITLTSTAGLAAGVILTLGADSTQETLVVSAVAGDMVSVPALAYAHYADEYAGWTSAGNTTAPRYRCGGAYSHATAPSDVIAGLIASFDGWMGQTASGGLTVYSGRFYAPTVVLGEDAIVSYQVDYGVEAESRITVYNSTYTSPDHDYTTVDAEPWRDDGAVALYGEKPSALQLAWVQDHGQARRLAKRAMTRQSAEWRGAITTNLAGMAALGERYVRAQIPELGIDCPAEVLKVGIDLASLTLTFQLIAADPRIDDWTEAEEAGTAPPVAAATYAGELNAPTISAVAVQRPDVNADIQGVSLVVTLAAALGDDQTVTLRWSTDGATWTEVAGLLISGAPAQSDVQVQAEVSSGDGRFSGWGAAFAVDTSVQPVIPPLVQAALDANSDAAAKAQSTADAAATQDALTALTGRVQKLEQQEQAQ